MRWMKRQWNLTGWKVKIMGKTWQANEQSCSGVSKTSLRDTVQGERESFSNHMRTLPLLEMWFSPCNHPSLASHLQFVIRALNSCSSNHRHVWQKRREFKREQRCSRSQELRLANTFTHADISSGSGSRTLGCVGCWAGTKQKQHVSISGMKRKELPWELAELVRLLSDQI